MLGYRSGYRQWRRQRAVMDIQLATVLREEAVHLASPGEHETLVFGSRVRCTCGYQYASPFPTLDAS